MIPIEGIASDKRPIRWIRFHPSGPNADTHDPMMRAHTDGVCDEIVAYNEMGEMAPVVWFAQIVDGVIVARHNGKYVDAVGY